MVPTHSYPPSFKGYLLDTNSLGLAAQLRPDASPPLFITSIQRDEFEQWSDEKGRERLRAVVNILPRKDTFGLVFGVSSWDEAVWTDHTDRFDEILAELTILDERAGKNSSAVNLARDALLISTALADGYWIVTNDANMRLVAVSHGVKTMKRAAFRRRYGE